MRAKLGREAQHPEGPEPELSATCADFTGDNWLPGSHLTARVRQHVEYLQIGPVSAVSQMRRRSGDARYGQCPLFPVSRIPSFKCRSRNLVGGEVESQLN